MIALPNLITLDSFFPDDDSQSAEVSQDCVIKHNSSQHVLWLLPCQATVTQAHALCAITEAIVDAGGDVASVPT